MTDEGRRGGGLDFTHERGPRSKWGRRSPYGFARHDGEQGLRWGPTYAALVGDGPLKER